MLLVLAMSALFLPSADAATKTLSVTDVTVLEGDSAAVAASFVVRLSGKSRKAVTVNFGTGNTSTEINDYQAQVGSLRFAPGKTKKTVTVVVHGDTIDETDSEVFTLLLSAPTNATILDGVGDGTITDDDAPPAVSVADASSLEGNAGTHVMNVNASLSAPSEQVVTVGFATQDASASASDYDSTSGTLTFPANNTTQAVAVTVKSDVLNETNETFGVVLTGPVNTTLADASGTGTITDDDPSPSISVGEVSTDEGDEGTTTMSFPVALSSASGRTVTASYSVADGSATAGNDYVSATGTITFLPGDTSELVDVTLQPDALDEPDETVVLTLGSPDGASIADGEATGTIADDDAAPSLSIDDPSRSEGNSGTSNLTFTVTLSAPSGRTVTVAYATNSASANSGTDFVSSSGTLTFVPGDVSKTFNVVINGDAQVESNEFFTVALSNAVNASVSDGGSTGTIVNDDGTLSINDASATEGTGGSSTLTFTVTLSFANSQTVTVNYGNSPSPDSSYTFGTLTFAPGDVTKSIPVALVTDTLDENDETFTMNLTNPSVPITDGQGVGTILDDDPPPSVSIGDGSRLEGNSGTSNMAFQVTLSGPSGKTVDVFASASSDTATSGTDFQGGGTTLTFSPGQTTKTFNVPIFGDATAEADETFVVNLIGPTNATIADGQGVGTITNDD